MRKDCETKTWNEVLSIINGKNQKNVEDSNGIYPIYGSGGIMGYANDFLCPNNTVIIGRKGNINKPIFVEEKFWNVDTAFGLVPKEGVLVAKYLFYYCVNYDFEKLNKAVTIPSLTKSDLLNIKIALPPLETQQQIVEELDCLSSIMEKQKKQLGELDNLAQSIFYDMFGDPIENEKGWEVKNLDEVCDVRDGTHDSPKYLLYSDYILITSKNIANGKLDFTNANYISKSDFDKINLRSKVDKGDILMAMIGTIGNPIIVNSDNINFCIKNMALIKLTPDSLVHRLYLHSLLSSKSFDELVKRINKGGTQKFIALGTIRKLIIPVPPLPLQEEFASKVEAIEKQKELIKKSIKETEDLFNSRMDYYFN